MTNSIVFVTLRKDDMCAVVGGGHFSEEEEQMCPYRGNVTLGEARKNLILAMTIQAEKPLQ